MNNVIDIERLGHLVNSTFAEYDFNIDVISNYSVIRELLHEMIICYGYPIKECQIVDDYNVYVLSVKDGQLYVSNINNSELNADFCILDSRYKDLDIKHDLIFTVETEEYDDEYDEDGFQLLYDEDDVLCDFDYYYEDEDGVHTGTFLSNNYDDVVNQLIYMRGY